MHHLALHVSSWPLFSPVSLRCWVAFTQQSLWRQLACIENNLKELWKIGNILQQWLVFVLSTRSQQINAQKSVKFCFCHCDRRKAKYKSINTTVCYWFEWWTSKNASEEYRQELNPAEGQDWNSECFYYLSSSIFSKKLELVSRSAAYRTTEEKRMNDS